MIDTAKTSEEGGKQALALTLVSSYKYSPSGHLSENMHWFVEGTQIQPS